MTRTELESRMTILLGDRAAESVVFDEVSTGAADDLVKATDIARSMVVRFGMTDGLGQVAYEDEPHRFLGSAPMPGMLERRYSESTAERIDEAVRDLIEAAFDKAATVLKERRECLESAAEALLAKETLTGEEIKELFGAGPSSATKLTDDVVQTAPSR